MGVLCINQVLDLLLLCAECVPCTVALLLYTGVENECRMAEDVSVLLTQHQRVVVERQDQGGVVVDPVQCLLARADLPVFRVCGIYPGGEGIQKGRKRLAEICVKRAVQVHVLCVLDRRSGAPQAHECLSCTERRFPRIAAKSLLAMQRACQRCIYPELVRRNHARSACAVRR